MHKNDEGKSPEEIKGIVVLQSQVSLSMEQTERIKAQLDKFCNQVGFKGLVVQGGIEASIHYDLKPLIDEIQETNKALKEFSFQTFQLTGFLVQLLDDLKNDGHDSDPDAEPAQYLDGTPV